MPPPLLANVTAPAPVDPPLMISSVPPLIVAALAVPPESTTSAATVHMCAAIKTARPNILLPAGGVDRVDSGAINSHLAAVLDDRPAPCATAQDHLIAGAAEGRRARNSPAEHILCAAIDDRSGRQRAGVNSVQAAI